MTGIIKNNNMELDDNTAVLSDYELSLVPMFIRSFLQYTTPRKSINLEVMTNNLRNHKYKVDTGRVKAIIDYIRRNEKILNNGKIYALLSDGENYWISYDKGEIEKCIKGLEQAAAGMAHIASAINITLTAMNYKRIQRQENEQRENELLQNQVSLKL